MTAQVSHGLWDYLFVWLFAGSGLLGLPAGERDAALVSAVPPQTLVYFEWAARGPGRPGAPGVEGFAADPEIQQFFQIFDAAMRKDPDPEDHESYDIDRLNHARLLNLAAAHAGCLFVGFEPPPAPQPGIATWLNMLLGVHGGVILSTGADTDAFWAKSLECLQERPDFILDQNSTTQSIPLSVPGYQLLLHREGQRVILALGNGTLPRALEGLTGKQPGLSSNPRFQRAESRVSVPQLATIAWVDGQGLLGSVIAALGPVGAFVRPVLTMAAVDASDSLIQVSGIDQGTMVQRSFLATNGRTDGIMALSSGASIQPQNLAHIPADADLVIAFSVSLPNLFQESRRLLAATQPLSVRVFDEAVKQLEKELELRIVDDILPAFGDVVTLFDSPSGGGLIATGLVGSLEVRDPAKAALVFDRVMKLVDQSLASEPGMTSAGSGSALRQNTFLGRTLYYVDSGDYGDLSSPHATPTFCLTERHFLFAIHPQAMKAYLRSLHAGQPGFDREATQKVPVPPGDLLSYVYVNGPRANWIVGAILPYIGRTSLLQFSGVSIDPIALPSAQAIAPYFGDSTAVIVRQKDGILIEHRNLPPVLASVLLLSAYREWNRTGFEEFQVRRRAHGADEVVPARAENQAAAPNPPLARRIAPLLLKALVPDGMQALIPESTVRRLEDGPPPDAVERRDATRNRREMRRQRRFGPTEETLPPPVPIPPQ